MKTNKKKNTQDSKRSSNSNNSSKKQNPPASPAGRRPVQPAAGRHVSSGEKKYPLALLAICVLFLVMTLTSAWTKKPDFALWAFVIFIFTFIFKENRQLLFGRVQKIFVILVAQCILYFIGMFYAEYPQYALQRFYLNLGALLIFASAYISFVRSQKNVAKLVRILSICIAIASLVSIEVATSGYLRSFFQFLASSFSSAVPDTYGAFETNTRITSVLGTPNVFAPLTVMGMFLSLWGLGRTDARGRVKFSFVSLAVACGAGFVLCFSLGTILTYIAAVAVYLLVSEKGSRGGQLTLQLYCLVMSLISASAVFALRELSILPLVAVVAVAVLSAFIYKRFKAARLPSLSGPKKKGLIAGVAAACIAFAAAASLLHGSFTLEKSESFRRAVALKPGDYTFSAEFVTASPDATVTVTVSSMSYEQAALKESTKLASVKQKSGATVSFTVPESSAAVFLTLKANNGMTIESAVIQGSGLTKQVSLKYLLLPEFIVNRLQGIWVNDNAAQRFVFFRDGLRLGMKAPVFGQGGGAYEGGLFSVADYTYYTMHTHNEYIERFIDGGIVGAALFVGLTVWVFLALLKILRTDRANPLLPLLAGSMVLIFLHAFIEVDFVTAPYRIAAYVLLALVAASANDALRLSARVRTGFVSACAALLGGTVLLATGQYAARRISEKPKSAGAISSAAVLDPVNRSSYMLQYIVGTEGSEDPTYTTVRDRYLKAMDGSKLGLMERARACFNKAEPDYSSGIRAAETYISENRIIASAWDEVFTLYNSVLDAHSEDTAAAAELGASLNYLRDYLIQINGTVPKKVEPALAVFMFNRAGNLNAGNAGVLIDSRIPCDLDQDGVSDIVSANDGQTITWQLKAPLVGDYVIKIYQESAATCEVTVNSTAASCDYDFKEKCYISNVSVTSQPVADISITTSMYTDKVYFTIKKLQ